MIKDYSKIMSNQLSKIYDDLFKRADDIVKKYNPCDIQVKDGIATCTMTRANPAFDSTGSFNRVKCQRGDLCCTGCNFHSKIGCTADKPLMCKLWLCNVAKTQNPKCARELQDIINEINGMELHNRIWLKDRGNKEMSMRETKRLNDYQTKMLTDGQI